MWLFLYWWIHTHNPKPPIIIIISFALFQWVSFLEKLINAFVAWWWSRRATPFLMYPFLHHENDEFFHVQRPSTCFTCVLKLIMIIYLKYTHKRSHTPKDTLIDLLALRLPLWALERVDMSPLVRVKPCHESAMSYILWSLSESSYLNHHLINEPLCTRTFYYLILS